MRYKLSFLFFKNKIANIVVCRESSMDGRITIEEKEAVVLGAAKMSSCVGGILTAACMLCSFSLTL